MNNSKDIILTYIANHPEESVLIYGAGNNGKRCLHYIKEADYFVDKRAKEILKIEAVKCISPEESLSLTGKKILIISISDPAVKKTIRKYYEGKDDFTIFEFVNTLEFDKYVYKEELKRQLKINIVYKEDGWILGKFATRLCEQLVSMGQDCKISADEDLSADINHYITYTSMPEVYAGTNIKRTMMITHVDTALKRDWVKMQTNLDIIGICMSRETCMKLQRWGISPSSICYINPAHDGEIKPRKINIGITNRCYHDSDYRKRDDLILQVMKNVDKDYFRITIMGEGWDEIVRELRENEVEVAYYSCFDRDEYMKIMPSLDYWLYYGFDEGAMGYLDALAAGIKTIVTPQGYHLDTIPGPTYTCSTINDFVRVFNEIANEKRVIVESVKAWSWENYAFKHLELWRYITGTISMKELFARQNEYMDGIFSLLIADNVT